MTLDGILIDEKGIRNVTENDVAGINKAVEELRTYLKQRWRFSTTGTDIAAPSGSLYDKHPLDLGECPVCSSVEEGEYQCSGLGHSKETLNEISIAEKINTTLFKLPIPHTTYIPEIK